MLKVPLTTVYANEVCIGDKRRGGQSHMARRVRTPWRTEPFASGADAADHAMLHGGNWILLIAARVGKADNWQDPQTDEEILRQTRRNAQVNILGRARRNSDGFSFA